MPRPPLPTVGGSVDTWGTMNNAVLLDLQTTADAIPTGGSDGQVLTKTSGTNYATAWETPAVGGSTITYDVTNFDSVGDWNGTTGTDNTPFWQDAVDQATADIAGTDNLARIYVPDGDYLVNPVAGFGPSSYKVCVYITTDNIRFEFAPGARIVLRTGHANGTQVLAFHGMVRGAGGVIADWADHWINDPANVTQYPIYTINAAVMGATSVTTSTAGNAANFAAGHVVLIRSGQCIGIQGSTATEPDGELNEVVSVNAGTGVVTLKYPTAKPYVQEYFHTLSGSTLTAATATTAGARSFTAASATAQGYSGFATTYPALLGIQNVTDAVLRNVHVKGGYWDLQPDAGYAYGVGFSQVIGCSITEATANCVNAALQGGLTGTFRDFVFDIRQHVHNTAATNAHFQTNTACSHGVIRGTYTTSGSYPSNAHIAEGSSHITLDTVTMHNPATSAVLHAIAIASRSCDITVDKPDVVHSTSNGNCIFVQDVENHRIRIINPRNLINITGDEIGNSGEGTLIAGWAGRSFSYAPVVSTPNVISAWVYHNSPTNEIIGYIPAYAAVTSIQYQVQQAFGGGSGSTLSIGIDGGSATEYVNALALPQTIASWGVDNARKEAPTNADNGYQDGSGLQAIETTYTANGATTGRVHILITWVHTERGSGI